jgi:hypothetical protein
VRLSYLPSYLLSSSVGATTFGGFWPALRFRSIIFYLYTSLSSFSLSSSLSPLLLVQTICLGLPTGLDKHGSQSVNILTVLVASILITFAAQRKLCDFINRTIFFFS